MAPETLAPALRVRRQFLPASMRPGQDGPGNLAETVAALPPATLASMRPGQDGPGNRATADFSRLTRGLLQ